MQPLLQALSPRCAAAPPTRNASLPTLAHPHPATMQSLASRRALGRPGMAAQRPRRGALQVSAGLKEVRDRIASVKNTMKITDAMKLVAEQLKAKGQARVPEAAVEWARKAKDPPHV